MKENKLSREQLIELVKKIGNPENDPEDISNWLDLLKKNVPDPAVSDLIFWPSKHGLGSNPSADEIVDKALSYKPIQL